MPTIIAFHGPASVGKSTAAKQMESALWEEAIIRGESFEVQMLSLADLLKHQTRELFGLTGPEWDGPFYGPSAFRNTPLSFELRAAPHVKTVRGLLEFIGTDVFRNQVDPDHWTRGVDRMIRNTTRWVIVPDLRFDSEAAWLRNYPSHYLGHLRFGRPREPQSCHACEKGLSPGMLEKFYEAGRLFRHIREDGPPAQTIPAQREAIREAARVIVNQGRFE